MSNKQLGTVKWFNQAKGYGFLAPDGGGSDVFVHVRDLRDSGLEGLTDGTKVAFVVEQDKRSGKSVARKLEVQGGNEA